jgi:hypothetical protein
MMARHGLPRLAETHAGVLLSLAVITSLTIVSLLSGSFGRIGGDGDDVMRLVQVRELLDGKGWFDLGQPRLGPEGGTLMHWSRLVDLPIAALAFCLEPLVGREAALGFAITFWPLISMLIVTGALVTGARALGGQGAVLFACILGFAILYRHFRFLPGAIDHHNLQLGLVLLGAVLLLPRGRDAGPMAVSGLSLAFAAAIGAEVYPFVLVIAAFVAADWALAGAPAQRGAVVFGASFAAGLAATFLATVPPLDYWTARCDAHSSVTMLAGLGGGVAFALAAQVASAKSLAIRVASLANVGALCAALVLVSGPACIGNPLDTLSPQARELWLGRVDEARSTFAYLDGRLDEFLFRLGTMVAGLAAAAWLAFRGEGPRAQILLILMLTVSLVLALYQTRFYVFGQLFAVLPLAVLAARLQAGAFAPQVPRLAYLGAVILALPAVWGVTGGLIAPSKAPPIAALAAEAAIACDPEATYAALNALPQGRILAPASDAPGLLLNTGHSALYGHYHRNTAGIDAALGIFTAAPEAARARLGAARVDYLLVCPADADIRFFAARTPNGLIAELVRGNVPAWMEPVGAAGPTVIYRVRPR